MPSFSRIAGEEASTVTFKLATVQQTRNSTAMHQEIMTIGGTESTLALAAVVATTPGSTDFGLVVREAAPTMIALPNNQTTSTLAGDATWTPGSDDLLGYSNVTIQLYADQGSASSGMTFQFSTDDTNFDDVYRFTMSSGTRRFQFPVCARYFRTVYTNGSTAQGAFRVAAYGHKAGVLTSIHRLEDETKIDRSAQLVKSALIAQKDGSTDVFTPIGATAGGNLKVAVQETDTVVTVSGYVAPSTTVTVSGYVAPSTTVTVAAITGPTSTAAPASGDTGVVVRQVGYSTVVTVSGYVAPSTTVVVSGVLSSLGGVVAATLNSTQNVGLRTSSGGLLEGSTATPATNAIGLHVRPVLGGLTSTSALVVSTASTAVYSVVSSATGLRTRVYAFSVTSTVAAASSCLFVSGTDTSVERWGLLLGSGSSGVTGANLAVSPPASLFETAQAAPLSFTATSTGVYRVSVAYWQEP